MTTFKVSCSASYLGCLVQVTAFVRLSPELFFFLLCTIYSRYTSKSTWYKKSSGRVASSTTNLSHCGLSCRNLGCIQKPSSLSRGGAMRCSPVLFLQLTELSALLSLTCHPIQKHSESPKGNRSSQEKSIEIKLTLIQMYTQNGLNFSLSFLFALGLPFILERVNVGWKSVIFQENIHHRCQRLFCCHCFVIFLWHICKKDFHLRLFQLSYSQCCHLIQGTIMTDFTCCIRCLCQVCVWMFSLILNINFSIGRHLHFESNWDSQGGKRRLSRWSGTQSRRCWLASKEQGMTAGLTKWHLHLQRSETFLI